jgi:hypothetical protein
MGNYDCQCKVIKYIQNVVLEIHERAAVFCDEIR